MTPAFLACLTGEVAVPLSELEDCETDPKSGGAQLRHPSGDGEEEAEYIHPEYRVRDYRDELRAPEGSQM